MNLTYQVFKEHALNTRSHFYDLFPNSLLSRNIKFKDIHKGERCFILGSGHSILTQDLTRLSGEIVMTQNHFHAHNDIKTINPKYHVLIPKYQPKEYDGDWNAWLDTMEKNLPPDTKFFLGTNTKYLIDERTNLSSRSYYIEPGYWSHLMSRAKVDISHLIMHVPTVITQCLTIAIYMGFSEMYLLGFDLDQVVRLVDRDKVRFYGNSPITANQSEKKFEKELGASGMDWFNMWTIWHQLNLLKLEAESRNIKIINATNGGLLDVFERGNYESIIAK
ncbi:MAG: hypothetical protein HYR67_17940 [Bacteroidetes bacterium]|nr:hypothetical protein [Bacteroidota bacterium]